MMKAMGSSLDLQEFFPVTLEIYDIVSDEKQITIYMKSKRACFKKAFLMLTLAPKWQKTTPLCPV